MRRARVTLAVGLGLLPLLFAAAGHAAGPVRIGTPEVADSVGPIDRKIEEIARTYAGTDIFLTDVRFVGLVERLRFKVQDGAYIKALQSGGVPSAKLVAQLKDAIMAHKAMILLYNRDAPTAATDELVAIANDAGIPVVGLGEKLPSGMSRQQWMLRQLNIIHGALNEASP
jgi:zinc/manganese transport system substrate-binding protein